MLKKLFAVSLVVITLLLTCSCYYYEKTNEDGTKTIDLVAANIYTVTFVGADGESVIKVMDFVMEGSNITNRTPTPPEIEGYTFVEWESNNPEISLNNITGNVTFTAKYSINTYNVKFKDKDDRYIEILENVEYGSDLSNRVTPPKKFLFVFTGWQSDKENVEITKITDNVTFKATYDFFIVYGFNKAIDWIKNLFN